MAGVIAIALLAVVGIVLVISGVQTGTTSTLSVGGIALGLAIVFSAIAALFLTREMAVQRNEQQTMIRNLQRRHEADLRRVEVNFADLWRGAAGTDPRLESLESHVGHVTERVEALQLTLIGHQRQLAILRKRMPTDSLKTLQRDLANNRLNLATIQRQVEDIDQRSLENALLLGKPPSEILDATQAATMVRSCIQSNDFISTLPLIRAFDVLHELTLAQSRRLYRFLRGAGYWDFALQVLEAIAQRSQNDKDSLTVEKIRSELAVYGDPLPWLDDPPAETAFDSQGPVLHLVGRVLPTTQSGYTLRTHYTAAAQLRAGLHPVVVGQSGSHGAETNSAGSYTVEGIEYRVLPGIPRQDQLLEDWLLQDARLLAECVLDLRPSVLHAHSDFLNGALAIAVGKHFGIPVVYESRGFWEESWLSRIVDSHGWRGRDEWIFSSNGLPLAYSARQRAEELVRQEADHVFTLANVMREHILDSASQPLETESVSTVPNAVDPGQFPAQTRDAELAEYYGIQPETVVVGYISSLVEYEGIDTLLRGFAEAQSVSEQPLHLLLVGDGPMTDRLRALAREQEISHVTFTGRVPHEDVLRYYGLIDIFVVPRSRSRVTELVTPLKPFEAFSTGRTVVMSDVNALEEIAGQSQACEIFEADNHRSLAAVLVRLIGDPGRREEMASQGANWVRSHRTWDSNVSRYLRIYENLGYRGASWNAPARETSVCPIEKGTRPRP